MCRLDDNQIKEIKGQIGLLKHDKLKEREHGDANYTSRDPFQRDYTRILYSSAFRRLQGKMQILGVVWAQKRSVQCEYGALST